ncbi:hypothetical protein [Allokutzneria oryzae]|uniref:Uncharacterized protein n=1 Tax=Allokutzneria oryzae TaxID=1378989 RepID=A0ABV6A188_9PSEU
MVTMIVTWVGIVAGLAVLVLMALSEHMIDKAQPEGRVARRQAKRTLHRPATATVIRRPRTVTSRFARVRNAA